MASPPLHQVLVVDDDPDFRTLVRLLLTDSEFSVSEAADGASALLLMRQRRFGALIVDIVMPDRDGLETIVAVHKLYPECPILATSGAGFRNFYLQSARLLGAWIVLEKPIDRDRLYAVLSRLTGSAAR
jgi:DNA-binding NtrC family response regulator